MWVGSTSDTFSEKRFKDRVRFLALLFGVAFGILVTRLFFLQVVKGDDFAQVSESNRTKTIFLSAPRGNFYDRNGKRLVANRPSWSLMYSVSGDPEVTKESVADRLRPFLEPFPKRWENRLKRAFNAKQLVRLAEDVPNHIAFGMREMGELLPGLRMELEFRREYPLGVQAPQLIGYLGEINEREIKDDDWYARKPGDLIGKMGLERILDRHLRGRDGGMLIEVDSIGRLKRVIRELPYEKGASVQLTLDADVQRVAEELLAASPTGRGAAVALDLETGGVLAWASAPEFDPSGSLAEDVTDPNLPFFDRVYKGSYPPGSTFKIITAAAGLEKGLIRLSDRITCEGYVMLKDRRTRERRYGCWTRHGEVDFWRAIAESCDSYFYLKGQQIGGEAIHDYAVRFGLGKPVQTHLPNENAGLVPSPAWKRRQGLGGWSTGDTFNMSIGQGYLTSTPLQIAQLAAILATRGRIYRPYFIERVIDTDGRTVRRSQPEPVVGPDLKESTWDRLQRAAKMVVEGGTGAASRIPGLDILAKTGTAQNPHGNDHAWFMASAGYKGERPRIAVCVFVENGGSGSVVAAPIAREMIRTFLPPRSTGSAA